MNPLLDFSEVNILQEESNQAMKRTLLPQYYYDVILLASTSNSISQPAQIRVKVGFKGLLLDQNQF